MRVHGAARAPRSIAVGAVSAVFSVLAAVGAGAQSPSSDASLLPPDAFAAGWMKAGPLRTFTSADLYGHINGGAEAFLELGFERLTVQRYEGSGGLIAVELYRMADAVAARGIYLARRGKEARDASLTRRHTVNPHQLLLQQDRFVVVVNNLGGGAAAVPVMVKAAGAIAAALPADVEVRELQLLPAAGLVEGSERIARGAFGLQAIYTLGDGDMLELGGRVTAVSGVYRTGTGSRWTLVVADYPSPSAATRAFEHVRANLDPLIRPVRTQGTRLVFQDYEKKFGIVSVNGRRLEIRAGLEQPPG